MKVLATDVEMLKVVVTSAVFGLCAFIGCSQQSPSASSKPDTRETQSLSTRIEGQIAEASCGQCQLKMKGNGCDLAVRIDGQSYFVDGSSIDDHGDAHGDDGLCNCIRKARVSGEIKEGRFIATSIAVLTEDENQ
jgi:hypothetical protein